MTYTPAGQARFSTTYTEKMDPRIRTRIVTAAFLALIALVVIGSLLRR